MAAPPIDVLALAERIEAARGAGFRPLLLLLERALGEGGAVGGAASPREERLRFRHDPSLVFPTADVAAVRERELPPDPEDFSAARVRVLEVVTTFLGLTGTVSPLPSYLAEEVAQDEADSPQRREFLDLFHHRMISLFHRARARCDWPGGCRSDQADPWSRRVLALLGLEEEALRASPAPPWRLLRYAPLLAERSLTAPALEAALEDALEGELGDARVRIEQFAGAWVEIAPVQQNRLGRSASTLGQDLLLGRRIFDRAGKFRVVVGPLSREGFARFSAEGPRRLVREIVVALSAEPLDHELVLWLTPEAAPRLELSARGATRLGRNSWLGGQVRETRIPVGLPA